PQQKLVDFAESLQRMELLVQAARATIDLLDQPAGLVRAARLDRLEAPQRQRRQALLQLAQGLTIAAIEIHGSDPGSTECEGKHERQHLPDRTRAGGQWHVATECDDRPRHGRDPLVDEWYVSQHAVPFRSSALPGQGAHRRDALAGERDLIAEDLAEVAR